MALLRQIVRKNLRAHTELEKGVNWPDGRIYRLKIFRFPPKVLRLQPGISHLVREEPHRLAP
jgi:hypothetical protein